MRYLIILMIAASAIRCWAASDLDQCVREHNFDKRKMCIAVATLDASQCDKIQNLDLKTSCIKEVRESSRRITWKIHPLDDKNTNLR